MNFSKKAVVAITNSTNCPNSVSVPKGANNRSHYVIKAGTKTTASENTSPDVVGVKIDLLPRTGFLKGSDIGKLETLLSFFGYIINMVDDLFIIRNVVGNAIAIHLAEGYGRTEFWGSEGWYGKIELNHSISPVIVGFSKCTRFFSSILSVSLKG